jgi:hypothetical protein
VFTSYDLELPAFGQILQAGPPRLLQLALKVVFQMNVKTEMLPLKKSSGKWTALLLLCLGISLFLLVYPVYVIRPFRHQGAQELRVALAVLRLRPFATAVAAGLAVLAAVQYWRTRSTWARRALAMLATAATFACAALSRINIFELMFHPTGRPEFVAASEIHLDGAEKVLAIRAGTVARAYPIRSISYHHIVNDRLGGIPIVATY